MHKGRKGDPEFVRCLEVLTYQDTSSPSSEPAITKGCLEATSVSSQEPRHNIVQL